MSFYPTLLVSLILGFTLGWLSSKRHAELTSDSEKPKFSNHKIDTPVYLHTTCSSVQEASHWIIDKGHAAGFDELNQLWFIQLPLARLSVASYIVEELVNNRIVIVTDDNRIIPHPSQIEV